MEEDIAWSRLDSERREAELSIMIAEDPHVPVSPCCHDRYEEVYAEEETQS